MGVGHYLENKSTLWPQLAILPDLIRAEVSAGAECGNIQFLNIYQHFFFGQSQLFYARIMCGVIECTSSPMCVRLNSVYIDVYIF